MAKNRRKTHRYLYKRAVIFGTFDKLHEGHKRYITLASNLSEKVIVFVMGHKLSRPTKIYPPQPDEVRTKQIKDYINSKGWDPLRFEFKYFHDRPTLYKRMLQKSLVDLVITGYEYFDRCYEMFQRRLDMNLPQFTILLHPRYREDGKEVTSTSIHLNLE